MSVDYEDIKEELDALVKHGEKGEYFGAADVTWLKTLTKEAGKMLNDYDSIRVLKRICLIFYNSGHLSDAAHCQNVLSKRCIKLALATKDKRPISSLDFLLKTFVDCKEVIIETQLDPALLPVACYIILIANAPDPLFAKLVPRRESLLDAIDEILKHRFRIPSGDERIQSICEKLKKLRADISSLALSSGEILKRYLTD